MEKIEFEIQEDGSLRTIYTDNLVGLLRTSGIDLKGVHRASNVEWDSVLRGWTVAAQHDDNLMLRRVKRRIQASYDPGYPPASFKSRNEALAAEIKHFWDLLPDLGEY